MESELKLTYKKIPKFTWESYKGECNINLQYKILIEKSLRKNKGITILAAKDNGIKHRTFLNMLHQHSINIEDYKSNKN